MKYVPSEVRRIIEGVCEICGGKEKHSAEWSKKDRWWLVICQRLGTTYLLRGEEVGKQEGDV